MPVRMMREYFQISAPFLGLSFRTLRRSLLAVTTPPTRLA